MRVALMIARRFKGVPSPVIATGQLTASTIIMIPVVLFTYGPAGLFSASPPVWAAVLALALLSTAFAYILYFNLVASAGATNASLVTLIVPASAILLGFLFLGERLELFEIGGMALIALRSGHHRRALFGDVSRVKGRTRIALPTMTTRRIRQHDQPPCHLFTGLKQRFLPKSFNA